MGLKGTAFSLLGGLLLFLADYPLEWPWLSCVAFLPLFWALLRVRSARLACACGAAWALGRVVPLGIALHGFSLPWPARLGLIAYLVALEVLFAWLVFRARGLGSWRFALLVGAVFTGIEWADAQLPMWGTARSLARLWVTVPAADRWVALVGVAGFSFSVVFVQALLILGLLRRERSTLFGALASLASVAVAQVLAAPARADAPRTLRVAAMGWGETSDVAHAEARIAEAAARGAKLALLPEVAFAVPIAERARFEAQWSAVAAARHIVLVVPFTLRPAPGNYALVFDAQGRKLGQYSKHHLVPLAEPYTATPSELLSFDVAGVQVGVMICQDDNFSDIARAYAGRGAQLLLVPSFEGPAEVAPYHFRNSRLRAAERRLPLVRAVAQGTSAVIGPNGQVLAQLDHAARGPGLLVADVPIGVDAR